MQGICCVIVFYHILYEFDQYKTTILGTGTHLLHTGIPLQPRMGKQILLVLLFPPFTHS